MNNKIFYFLVFFLFFIINVFAKKLEINEMKQLQNILKTANVNSLVIFDVDEVLIYPENVVQLQIASPFWESSMIVLEQRLGKEKRDLLHSIMLLQSNWKLTDNIIPDIIYDLQLRKIKVLALTAFRGGKMGKINLVADWRNNNLKKHGIIFTSTKYFPKKYFKINKLKTKNKEEVPIYKDGIIYANNLPKGQVLKAFLSEINFMPKEIIFIDDRISNIKNVENFCKTKNIHFLGIHYTNVMKKHSIFNKRIGEYQFYYLEHNHIWLSDSEAERKMIQRQVQR
jgi:hypothetical protein